MLKHLWILVAMVLFGGCLEENQEPKKSGETVLVKSEMDMGGGGKSFKIPLSPEYNWEVTQSWAEHCKVCDAKYPSDNSYCVDSHTLEYSEYGWDFNLPGTIDLGKEALATADGTVKKVSSSKSWGNYVVIDHGDNVCSRYAHLLDGSTDHLSANEKVCQGLVVGKIGQSGYADGPHLHFQFEECDTSESLRKIFTDGNSVPVCTVGKDVFDSKGVYNLLKLTNTVRESCDETDTSAPLDGGWTGGICGDLNGCPINPDCKNPPFKSFSDQKDFSSDEAAAAAYLWDECVIEGKADGKFWPKEKVTRVESLKMAMYLFGLMKNCNGNEPVLFGDVKKGVWYYEVVGCALKHKIVTSSNKDFNPHMEANVAEVAKFATLAAEKAGVIELINEDFGASFKKVPKSHWAYDYIATLYSYGGLPDNDKSIDPDEQVTRGEFTKILTSLSPCYCPNVECDYGCVCNQASFACIDPDAKSSGTGGGGEEEELPEIVLDCYVSYKFTECVGESLEIDVRCTLTNNADEEIQVQDMTVKLDGSGEKGNCEVTKAQSNTGVGYQDFAAGETKNLSGSFDITCKKPPQKNMLKLKFDMRERYSGKEFYTEDVASFAVEVEPVAFGDCKPKPAVVEPEPEEPVVVEPEPPKCVPFCANKACGDDGCGGSCGQCDTHRLCEYGQCVEPPCQTKCTNKNCGDDGCGGICGECSAGDICLNANCMGVKITPACVPSCSGKTCGSDGCGGTCGGLCPGGQVCDKGQCVKSGNYVCDYNLGYSVFIGTPVPGKISITTKSGTNQLNVKPLGDEVFMSFKCEDLPATMVLDGFGDSVKVYIYDLVLPDYWWPFLVWEATQNNVVYVGKNFETSSAPKTPLTFVFSEQPFGEYIGP